MTFDLCSKIMRTAAGFVYISACKVHIYCLKHYTFHVLYTGTFIKLFILVCASILV